MGAMERETFVYGQIGSIVLPMLNGIRSLELWRCGLVIRIMIPRVPQHLNRHTEKPFGEPRIRSTDEEFEK